MNPEKIREDFPYFKENSQLAYLDNAATSQKPLEVIEAVESVYRKFNANVGRGIYDNASITTQKFNETREKVSEFINSRPSEVIFVRNTTEAVNLVADTLELEKVVLPETSHHSLQLPFREISDFEFIPVEDGQLDIEEANSIIDEDTDMVAVSQISNVYGVENPLDRLREISNENDAYFMVDAAQSAPRKRINVKQLGVDFLVFSSHKMLGPSGVGILYGRKQLLQEMDTYQVGGGMVEKVTSRNISYQNSPSKFEAGTPNIEGVIGFKAALDYLEDVNMREIVPHEKKLNRKFIDYVKDVEGIKFFKQKDDDVSILSFNTEFAHPHDIAEIMNRHQVAVRAGHHCAQPLMEKLGVSGTVRLSPYLYNTEKDIVKAAEALIKAEEVFN